jgi:Chlorophyll A-B binding protein
MFLVFQVVSPRFRIALVRRLLTTPLVSNCIASFAHSSLGKQQIIGLIFLAEIISESNGKHYTKGGDLPTIIFPPIDFSSVDAETLKQKKDSELNNGRLAMISIMSFVAAANIPGSVPALADNPMF